MLCLLQNLMTALIPQARELTFSKHFVTPKPLPNPSPPSFEVLVPINWVGVGTNTETSHNVLELGLFLRLTLYLCGQERWNGPSLVFTNTWKELEHLQKYDFKNAYKYHASLLSNFTHLLSLKTVIDFTTKNLIHNFCTDFCLFVRFCFCVCPLPTINMAAVNDQLI